jgi:thiamine-monophosphate kinase
MPSNPIVTDLGEKKIVERILSKSKKSIPPSSFFYNFFDNKSFKSLSDDAALLDIGDNYLVITSDMLFERSHFPEFMSFHDIGSKSVVVNLSDLAAMGAKPIGIIISLGLNSNMLLSDFDAMLDGILSKCKEYDIVLLGGDTNQAEELTICGTAIGIVDKKRVIMKSGADVGDIVAVTGYLGLAAGGFEILFHEETENGCLTKDEKHMSIDHALRPDARVKEGIKMSGSDLVTSATDITDGLVSEMFELISANSGRIGIRFYEDKLPITNFIKDLSKKIYDDPLELALYYGEDFEILLTIPKEKYDRLNELFSIHEIGEVTDTGKIEIINYEEKSEILKARGYEHLKRP